MVLLDWFVVVCVVFGNGAALGYVWLIVLGFDEEWWKELCGGFGYGEAEDGSLKVM